MVHTEVISISSLIVVPFTQRKLGLPQRKTLNLCNSNNMDPFKLVVINHWLWINKSLFMNKLQYLTIPNRSADFLLSLFILDSEDQIF